MLVILLLLLRPSLVGPIVVIFGSAALVYYNILPKSVTENVSTFMKGGGFLDFYIAALLLIPSWYGRKVLVKASVRYLPCILGAVIVSLAFVALVDCCLVNQQVNLLPISVFQLWVVEWELTVPISSILICSRYTDRANLSRLVPAVALGNAMAIVAGGLLDRLGKNVQADW